MRAEPGGDPASRVHLPGDPALQTPSLDPYAPVRADLDLVAARVRSLAAAGAPPLDEAAASLTRRPGKMVRPALLLLAAMAGPPAAPARAPRRRARIMAAATAFELLHLASLIHDDILDASPLRRGEISVWGSWGTGVAVLAGDHLYGKAVSQASLAGRRASRSLCRVIDALLVGQALEIQAAGPRLGRRGYMALATAKTAAFCAECCSLGAILGGAGSRIARALRGYGLALGQAYQLLDDLLDWIGHPNETGKPCFGDLAGGHLTFPVIVALDRRPVRVGRAITALREAPSMEERAGVLADLALLLASTGALEETINLVRARTLKAVSRLAPLPPGVPRENLEALALGLAMRKS